MTSTSANPAGAEPATPSPSLLRRATAAAAMGNATEWFDYGVYSYLATQIGRNFFPGPHATLGSLLVFAVSFVLRPLGGIVWGPLGDRVGRQSVLVATILLMSLSTVLIGVIPTYGSVGVWAPVLLILLRVVQGFSTGGEYGGAATFLAEYAPDRRRGFWGSFLEFGTLTGFTGALALTALINLVFGSAALDHWAWRIPFLAAGPLGAIGLYLRMRLEDTPCFRDLKSRGERETEATGALRTLLRDYRRPMLQLFGLVVVLNVADYTLLTYLPTYLQDTIGLSTGDSNLVLASGQLGMMAVIPFAGMLSDRVGRKPCWWFSIGALFVLSVPMFWLMSQGLALAIVGFVVLGMVFVLQLGTISATFPAMFPAHVRYAGMAISYNIATAAFGGTAPAINNALVGATHDKLMPGYYLMAACVIGACGLWGVVETRGCSLRGRRLPRAESQSTGVTRPPAPPVAARRPAVRSR
ncbi:MAG TPA: MFS transporter [Solirubrobacteraceae bacterium]